MSLTIWALILFANGQPFETVRTFNDQRACLSYKYAVVDPAVIQSVRMNDANGRPVTFTTKCMSHKEWE